jgi:hypothetical protein
VLLNVYFKSAKPAMPLLRCGPEELAFSATPQAKPITLRNTSSSAVAFKVKTTAPLRFAVAPVSGLIQPGQSIDVRGVLRPLARAYASPPPQLLPSRRRCRPRRIRAVLIAAWQHCTGSDAEAPDLR